MSAEDVGSPVATMGVEGFWWGFALVATSGKNLLSGAFADAPIIIL